MTTFDRLPELLAPAGSPEALRAAVAAGADAVYLGAGAFNARAGARNFAGDVLREAVAYAHAYGTRVYLTLNTLVYDRETAAFLRTAEEAYLAGADALIVQDLGGARLLSRYFPAFPLHASTQMSGHCADMGAELHELGFDRMVVAREISLENLRTVCRTSPIAVEMFVHGALCVCHSGQCLFSSIVGGRSGNRGECAQPCRLPYGGAYPLSLKDLSLAQHIPEIIGSGVASLKIEGRMKSPEYVGGVVRVWRRLLNGRRSASAEEMRELSDLFSRGGFTDGYFTEHVGHAMLGIRSDADKQASRTAAATPTERKLPLSMDLTARAGQAMTLAVCDSLGRHAEVTGPAAEPALDRATAISDVVEKLTRLGGTPFACEAPTVTADANLLIPFSALNAMRRDAVAALLREPERKAPELPVRPEETVAISRTGKGALTVAYCFAREQVTDRVCKTFDRVYLFADACREGIPAGVSGIILPPVVFDGERESVLQLLRAAAAAGVKYAAVGNLGHLALVREAGLCPTGWFRLNVTNRASLAALYDMGVTETLLSPEPELPRLRDLCRGTDAVAVVYGRIPLMVTEKCVGTEIGGCTACDKNQTALCDRMGVKFPVRRILPHRSILWNSVPTYMADKSQLLTKYGIASRGFLFTVESPQEVDAVIDAYRQGRAPDVQVRRIAEAPVKSGRTS